MTKPRLSFEFFPPKTLDASFRLWDAVRSLAPLAPDFVSVTYGAGGTTRKLTHEAVETIHTHYKLNVAAHLTCVDATRAETLEIAEAYHKAGVREIVALRGDPPKGSDRFTAHPEGFADSCELVAALAETGKFTLRVGAYPDPHPEAADEGADVRWLKRKFEAGADSAITQFFFETDTFLRFRDACASAGIHKPVIPGIVPIDNWTGVRKFALNCGARIPQHIDVRLTEAQEAGTLPQVAREMCVEMCRSLMEAGVQDLHFYTLNKPDLTRAICADLGIAARPALDQVA